MVNSIIAWLPVAWQPVAGNSWR